MRRATFRRRLRVLAVFTAVLLLPAQTAFAWTVAGFGGANGAAAFLAADAAPAASVFAQTATVSWSVVTFAGSSTAATGYTVNRVWRGAGAGPNGEQNGDKEPATGACAGTIAGLSCTTSHPSGQTWSYTVTPQFAGWVGAESPESAPVRMPGPPSVTAIALTNSGTTGTANAGDSFTITFSELLDPQSICSGFNADPTVTQTATGLALDFAGNPNVISVTNGGTCQTSGLGTLQVGGNGNGRYTRGGQALQFTNSTLTWNPTERTITVTFGTTTNNTNTNVAAATAVYTPGALTGSGLAITPGPVNSASPQQF